MKNVTPNPPKAIPAPSAWDQCVTFHGHACPGLAVGCRMALAAVQALTIDDSFLTKPQALNTAQGGADRPPVSPDEELVCVSETDACGVDAVQSLLGCTMGKGNLMLTLRGKSAMSFYYRPARKAVRVLWTAPRRGADRDETMRWFLSAPESELLEVREIPYDPPARAVISKSLACAGCGEATSEALATIVDGRPYCLDCRP